MGTGQAMAVVYPSASNAPGTAVPAAPTKRNIVVIWGDDIGQSDISAYTKGLMGFRTPNIDRFAKKEYSPGKSPI